MIIFLNILRYKRKNGGVWPSDICQLVSELGRASTFQPACPPWRWKGFRFLMYLSKVLKVFINIFKNARMSTRRCARFTRRACWDYGECGDCRDWITDSLKVRDASASKKYFQPSFPPRWWKRVWVPLKTVQNTYFPIIARFLCIVHCNVQCAVCDLPLFLHHRFFAFVYCTCYIIYHWFEGL